MDCVDLVLKLGKSIEVLCRMDLVYLSILLAMFKRAC